MIQEQVQMVFRRGAKSPINSIKHVIDTGGDLSELGTTSVNTIAVAVPNVDSAVFKPGDIRVGATINGFFLSVFVIGATGAGIGAPINWFLMKLHDQQTSLNPGATGVTSRRNQVIHEEKGLAGSADGTAMAFKGVVVVPKGMRRMREGDSWVLSLALSANATSDANFCVKAIYKSFF